MGVVQEIRLFKNMAHQMDKHLKLALLFFIAIRQLLNLTNDLKLRVFFKNRIQIISGQWVGDNERLSRMKPHLRVKG